MVLRVPFSHGQSAIVAASFWRRGCFTYLSYSCGCVLRANIRSCVCRVCDLCVQLCLYVACFAVLVRSFRFIVFTVEQVVAVVIGFGGPQSSSILSPCPPPAPSLPNTRPHNGPQLPICFAVHVSGGVLCVRRCGHRFG